MSNYVIPYSYEIKKVQENKSLMEVEYSSYGKTSITKEVRFPFVNENLDELIRKNAPLDEFFADGQAVAIPVKGYKGTFMPAVPAFDPSIAVNERELSELTRKAYMRAEVEKVLEERESGRI